MQLIKSLDELLYEVMSWLIFYPVTLWRTLRHPLATMVYADNELSDADEQQYTDTLSPPIFLVLSLLLAHAIQLALVGHDDTIIRDKSGLGGLVNDETSLLILRVLIFSIFPLMMSTRIVRRRKSGLTRDTLRPLFFAQCYLAAPFALAIGFGATLTECRWHWLSVEGALLSGFGIMLTTLILYGIVQARWFAQMLKTSFISGFGQASIAMIESVVLVLIILPLF
jgi:hypothetical protein